MKWQASDHTQVEETQKKNAHSERMAARYDREMSATAATLSSSSSTVIAHAARAVVEFK